MNQCIINPSKGKREPALPPLGVFAVNPSDTRIFSDLAKKYSLQRSFLFHSQLYHSERFFIAGPAVGAPMAAMCLEKLIALGAQNIIVYGWCGSLQPSLEVGDILIPESGVSEEGTSAHYLGGGGFKPDSVLKAQLEEALLRHDKSSVSGRIWTTDAPYRETNEKVYSYQQDGVCGVDMEYTALCAVAAFRKISLAAVMLVSDELYKPEWKPHYGQKAFSQASSGLLRIFCEEMENGGITI